VAAAMWTLGTCMQQLRPTSSLASQAWHPCGLKNIDLGNMQILQAVWHLMAAKCSTTWSPRMLKNAARERQLREAQIATPNAFHCQEQKRLNET